MSSTEIRSGFDEGSKPSSRVLKPPGGGHSNIFGDTDHHSNPPRPKYNQQNSSNMNDVMGTVDPNIKPGRNTASINNITGGDEPQQQQQPHHHPHKNQESQQQQQNNDAAGGRHGRVPPGGFSSGLW